MSATPPIIAGSLPPHDLDAEAAVLSAIMLVSATLDSVAFLKRKHFYSDANGWIFEAMAAMALEGTDIDIISVSRWLRDRGQLDAVGKPSYLAQILDATPAVTHVEIHARIVYETWQKRQMSATLQRLTVECYIPVGDHNAWIAQAADEVRSIAEQGEKTSGIEWISIGDPPDIPVPKNFLVPGLNIAPGAPTGVFAYSWSGKSIILQDLALSIATGTKTWGHFDCRQGAVRHLDLEQGRHETEDRYHRLLRGRGIKGADIAGRLQFKSTSFLLDSPQAEEQLKRLFDGYALGVIDTFLAGIPTLEENDAKAALPLYMCGRVSEATGCTIVIAGHTGKYDLPEQGGGTKATKRDARGSPRGNSSIIGACGTAFHLSGPIGEPKAVTMIKGRSLGGMQTADCALKLESVLIDGYSNPENPADPGGFRVVYQAIEAADSATTSGPSAQQRATEASILNLLRRNPGAAAQQIRDEATGSKEAREAGRKRLVQAGELEVRQGPRGKLCHYLKGHAPAL